MSNNPILDMLFHTWQFSAMSTAHRLGVFSRLDERAMSAAELARETYSVPHLLEAVLDACVAIGLLHREQGRYANSHLSSAYLVEGRPLYLGHILEVQARDAARWAHAYDIVKTGEVPDFPGEVGEQDATFTLAMNDLGAQGEAEALAGAVDLSRCGTLLDIGCGSGLYSITLCRHYPQLVAILVDRETVLRMTERLVAASGLAGRIRVRAGDMATDTFEDGMDAVLLSDSLYFDETISTRILRSAYRALNPGGIVIIRGYYPDPEGAESLFGAIFRINLLLFEPNRRPPAVADIARQLVEVGFSGTRMFALTERSTCFIGIK